MSEREGAHPGNNFDAVRLVAALAVLASHLCLVAGRPEPGLFGPITLGAAAVLVFFSVSGYLVASSWAADPKLWRFAARRFLRIWPAYAVVVVATVAAVLATDSRPLAHAAAWLYLAKRLTLHSFDWNFFPGLRDPRLNAPLWTIVFEIGCYAGFALLAAPLRKWWPRVVFPLAVPAFLWWGHGMAAFDATWASTGTIATMFAGFFGAGAALAAWPALRSPRASAALVAMGIVAYVSGSQIVGLALALPTVAVFVGTRAWPVLRRAGRFGDLSYGLYLWAWPVQQVVASQLGAAAGYWRLLFTSLLIVTPMAALSWHLVEKRALRAKPSSRTPWPRLLTLEL